MLVFQYKTGVPVPGAPTNLSATAGDGEVVLTWDAPAGTVDSYTVHFKAGSSGVTTGDATVPDTITGTTVTHTGLTNGTEYFYAVTATNVSGTGPLSNEDSDTPVAPPVTAWTFSATETFDTGQTFDFSSQATTGFNLLEVSHDGLHAYTGDCDGGSVRVYQYDMSSAWDLSTMSYASKSMVMDTDPGSGFCYFSGICFKPDGTSIYGNGGDGEVVNKLMQYNLSTPWDLSTAGSLIHRESGIVPGFPPPEMNGLYIDPTGTYVYFSADNVIRRCTMSTSWALSTISAINQTYTPSGISGGIHDVSFDPTGLKIFISDSAGNFHEDQLTVAWDLSTASSTGRHSYNPTQTSEAGHLCWKWDDGKKFFAMDSMFGASTNVYRYTIT